MLPGTHRTEAKGRVYWRLSREAGAPLLWSGRACDEAAAALEIATEYARATDTALASGTVGRLIEDYRKSAKFKRLAPQTQALYEQFLEAAIQRRAIARLSLGEFGAKKGRDAIRAWRAEAALSSPRTADQIRTVLGAVATWGRSEDRLTLDCAPCADMEVLYHAPKQHAWTDAEIRTAERKLPSRLAAAVGLALNTGLRREDLVTVRKDAVLEKRGVLIWATSKGKRFGREAIIDLTPPLRTVLRRAPKHDAPTILANSRGEPWTADGLHHALVAALEPLSIAKTLHGLRRSAATRLEAQGFTHSQIARRLGWSEKEVASMLATYVDDELAAKERSRWTLSAPIAS